MLIGYNNDVEYRGKTFHIQTEDRGVNDDTIETQLFQGGAILDTNITNYTELVEGLEGKPRDKKIKSIMKASHKSLFKKLMAGEYDEMVGLEPLDQVPEEVKDVDPDLFQPGQDRVPQAAQAIEEGNLEGLEDPGGNHVGLSQLKNKLATLKERSSSSAGQDGPGPGDGIGQALSEAVDGLEEESVGAATMVMEERPEMSSGSFDTAKLKARLARNGAADALVEIPSTGVLAWPGCDEPGEDLSLTDLVEDFLAS